MPKENKPAKQKEVNPDHFSVEADAYLQGLFQELHRQGQQYMQYTEQRHNLEARLELAEKTLSLTRDHLAMTIRRTDSATPRDWTHTLERFRFVGVRLMDACMALLQEKKKMTADELLAALNKGLFRFRTNSPQQRSTPPCCVRPSRKKNGSHWVWTGKVEQQLPMRLRLASNPNMTEMEEKEKASK